jgi:Na+-driven multidrug efflux pump
MLTLTMHHHMHRRQSDIVWRPVVEREDTLNIWTRANSRFRYSGSLAFNFLAFLLPALYSTLSKLWVANIDASFVATTDVYTYMSTVAEVLNEGLPRTAWLIIGDTATRSMSSRISLSYTMLIFQTLMGLMITVVFVGAAERFAASFVPEEVRSASLSYVRLSAPVALSSAIQVAVASCTRALDQPDVPLIISSVGFVLNIVLDLLIISKFHVGSYNPTVLTQAGIRLACDMTSALAGVVYFVYLTRKLGGGISPLGFANKLSVQMKALKILAQPAKYTFAESLIRNAIYLWVVSTIIGLGSTYATAWGVFNTVRWGLIMVPVNALQASSLAFVGHQWSVWHNRIGSNNIAPTATRRELKGLWLELAF